MRSIRLSLILCILVLLVLSLGAVSGLVYRTTERSLAENNAERRALLIARVEERKQREREKLDEMLLADANNLASVVSVQIQWPDWVVRNNAVFGILSAASSPHGHLQYPLWLNQLPLPPPPGRPFWNNELADKLVRMRLSLKFSEIEPPHENKGRVAVYYQINTVTGDEWRSESMGEARFAFNPKLFSSDQIFDWRHDTLDLEPGIEVRHVVVKVSQFRFDRPAPARPFRRPPPGRNEMGKKLVKGKSDGAFPAEQSAVKSDDKGGKSLAAGDPKQPPRPPAPRWSIYVHAAADTSQLKKALAEHDGKLAHDLHRLEEDYQASLDDLGTMLLLINGGTFTAALLLGCLLVYLGLSPLRRLSDAVSRVSEKDFRLSLDVKKLPMELRPIADRLNVTLDQLRRAFEREKQAAADISHELRTPVAAMLATLEVGLRKQRSAEEYRELLEECREAGQQMSQLVERLLALARLDAGADHLRPQEVDVARLAEQCAALVKPLAEARGLSLTVEKNGPAAIKADPDKLREVLTNLLHNAIEYNKPHGAIRLKVGRDNGTLLMQVSDTGIGIPPEAKDRIFERFYRQDPSRQSDGLHAGIGLALVKGYVDLMGGKITVDSTVGQGTTFRIQLPVREHPGNSSGGGLS